MSAAIALPLRHAEQCMGTVFSFDVRSPGVDHADLARVLHWLHETDARFSTFRADSEISRIASGALATSDAHPDVRTVLDACLEWSAATDGFFSAYTGGRLDPSGYVKGWAIRAAAAMLSTAGSVNHCVNGGGDVTCVGRPAPGRGWRVGVADPRSPMRVLRTIEGIGPLAVATSGSAERGAHIVDPHTGARPTALSAVTVIARDVVRADVLATAAVAMGPAGAWLRTLDGIEAVVVHADGDVTRIASSGTVMAMSDTRGAKHGRSSRANP